MVHDATRRAHHHMCTVLQTQHLATQCHTTTQSNNFHIAHSARQTSNLLTHLICQLARWAQNHGLHRKISRQNFFNQGNAKGCCFATARAGLRNQILARQSHWQTGSLNGRHLQIAQLL